MNSAADVRERLVREDPNFRRLSLKHAEYDKRLEELTSRKFLTREEQLDLSDAYGVGIGDWDKMTVRYAYSDFPDGADEARTKAFGISGSLDLDHFSITPGAPVSGRFRLKTSAF